MLMTIYWYGIFCCVITTFIVGLKLIHDPRIAELMKKSENGGIGDTRDAWLRILLVCICPILHWIYSTINFFLILDDDFWNTIVDKVEEEYGDNWR